MSSAAPQATTVDVLLERYDALLLDAYGVLIDSSGPLPGAVPLIEHLNASGKPYFILTNSASRLPETMAADLAAQELRIGPERLVTSGALLPGYFAARGLHGKPCIVLGPEDSHRYVERAGGIATPVGTGAEAEVVVLADQKGFALLDTMDALLTLLLRRLDADQPVELILCNPDLIYPQGAGRYGFTSGALALMIEGVLAERYPERRLGFVRLGKPYAPLFEEAARRAGTRNLVMIGDQLATDILGASRFGIDSALIASGLARESGPPSGGISPTYLLASLQAST